MLLVPPCWCSTSVYVILHSFHEILSRFANNFVSCYHKLSVFAPYIGTDGPVTQRTPEIALRGVTRAGFVIAGRRNHELVGISNQCSLSCSQTDKMNKTGGGTSINMVFLISFPQEQNLSGTGGVAKEGTCWFDSKSNYYSHRVVFRSRSNRHFHLLFTA